MLKFALSLLLVTVLIGSVSAYTYTETTSQLEEEAETEYTSLAQQGALDIQEWREERSVTTRTIAQFNVMESGDNARIQQFLTTERQRLPEDVINLHLVDLNTRNVLASSEEGAQGFQINSKEAPWITQGRTLSFGSDQVFISTAYEAHGYAIVSFVTPVEGAKVLVVESDLDAVSEGFSKPTEDAFTQVIDSQGRVVAGTTESDSWNRNDGILETYSSAGTSSPVIRQGQDGAVGLLGETAKEQELSTDYVTAFAPVAGVEWVIATHVPASHVFRLRSLITQNLAILFATTLLGLGLIAGTFGRGTVQSVNELAARARMLESGDLDTEIESTREDELGQLTSAFENMRTELREQISAAESAKREADVARAEVEELNAQLLETAEAYSEVMAECAAGDLTQRMVPDERDDTMTRIAEDFNEMIGELEKTVGQLNTFADDVAESGEVVLSSAESVRSAAEQVADSTQKLSADAERQREQLASIAADLDALAEMLDDGDREVADGKRDHAREVVTQLQSVIEASEEMLSESQTVAAAAEEQAAELNEVSNRADRLKRYAKPLGNILNQFETENQHEFVFSGGPSNAGISSEAED